MGAEQLEARHDGTLAWVPPSRWWVREAVPPFGAHQLRHGPEGREGRLVATFNPAANRVVLTAIVEYLNRLGVTPDGWT